MTNSVMKFKILILLFLQFHLIKSHDESKITCRDENNESIDWYYLYKLPSTYKNSHGLNYLYITSNSYNNGWKLSNQLISNYNSLPGQTLLSIFNNTKIFSLAYNDELPNGKVNKLDGHTKGIIAANINSGFWLIHSVPKYPSIDSYIYPINGLRYGQSFLCITFNNSQQINDIAKQLIYNEPNIYHINLPDNLKNLYSNFIDVINKKWKKDGPFWQQSTLISSNGIKFISFAKNRKFHKELYEDWIAPILNTDLYVETWRNGEGNLPSNCSRLRHVLNVARLEIEKIDYSFKSTEDHSKWTVGVDNQNNNNKDWICVGDINRQKHQLQRGGGTICQFNPKVALAYRNLIKTFDPCSS